ncbi:cytoplasmic protein, partial [Bacillus cereus]
MEHQHSLTVNGSGSSAGGDYNKVKIRGEGTISNDMSCNEFKTYGTSEVCGNMKVKSYVVYGDSEVQG